MTHEPTARYRAAADLFDDWHDDLLRGEPPVLFPVGFEGIEVGPGLVTLIGGAPGAGKTALAMQWVFEALRARPTLKALVCNVEMSPAALLDRQLARLSGNDATTIRHRRFGPEHAEMMEKGMEAVEAVAERLAFVKPPSDLANVAASADAFGADLIVLDYLQRIPPPGPRAGSREAVNATMNYLRQFCDVGIAVIVVSSLARSKDQRGRSSYTEGLSLASFRESAELEYGADDAFILGASDEAAADGSLRVTLKHLKSRHGETRDRDLIFDRPRQRFRPIAAERPTEADGRFDDRLRDLWSNTAPAPEDDA